MAVDVAFHLSADFQLLDLAGPLDAFVEANAIAGRVLYRTALCSRIGGSVVSQAGVPVPTVPIRRTRCRTLLVVGGAMGSMSSEAEAAAVRGAAAGAERIAAVCTGAFLLAGAGLLDGRRATTHWACSQTLASRHPAVRVEPDRIFVADGPIWTSAGVTAGIDLALALIEADHGVELARAVARALVVHHRRPGGQAQFAALSEMEPASDRIRIALAFMRTHLAEALPVERLAEAARLSPRQFGRVFRRETCETPSGAVERLRAEAARLRLQEGTEPIEFVARAVGFGDPERMRRAFVRRFGQSPQAVRRQLRG